MKPLRLELSHLGPFTRHEVDLEPFRDEGLFLIHGDTGSGKSTLLDAMSFALYGRGLGARGAEDLLRNRAARPDAPTRAALTFSLGDRVYRVTRSSECERAGRSGVTKQRAEATLECLHGDAAFETVSNPRKVTAAVESLLRVAHEQFARIMVLPQGEFRELLLARADDRERMLELLFGSAIYSRIEDRLRELERAAEADEGRARSVIEGRLLALGVDDFAGLQAARAEVEAQAAHADAAAAQRRAEADRLAADAAAAREHAARLARRTTLTAARAEAEAAVAAHQSLRQRLLAHRAALPCVADGNRVEALLRSVDDCAASAARERQALDDAQRELAGEGLSRTHLVALDARIDSLQAERERLAGRCADADALREARASITRMEDAAAALARDQEAQRAALAVRAARRDVEATALDLERAALAESLPAARARSERLESRIDAARERDQAAQRVRESERVERDLARKLAAAGERADEALARFDDVQARHADALAAALAQHLRPGQPCPVCGSSTHPAPAGAAETEVDRDAVQAARAAWQHAEAARREVDVQLRRAQGEVAVRREQLDERTAREPSSLEDLDVQAAEARETFLALRRRETQLDEAVRAWSRERDALVRALREVDDAGRSQEAQRTKLTELTAHAADLAERLAGVDVSTLSDARAGVEASLREALEARERARGRRVTLEAQVQRSRVTLAAEERAEQERRDALRRAEQTLAETLAAAGLTDLATARRAAMRDDEVAQGEATLAGLDAAHRRAAASLAAVPEADPDLAAQADALQLRAAEARTAVEDAQRTLGAVNARCSALRAAETEMTAHAEALRHGEARWRTVRTVAAAVNGRAAGRTRLSRYVLVEAWERAVACASARLEVISDGRFRLRRREIRQVGREFELAVTDAYHGAGERPAASLSGGEMFLASLAMALGLSDVIQAEAGGVRIESLFVDEGFGTLDEDALDKAVAVLEQLRARHRLVGVVSHVAELRRRIPARLEVLRTDAGSVTRTAIRAHARGLREPKP
ncbi:MAG: SMC family ATPase [Polyangiales bacterium]